MRVTIAKYADMRGVSVGTIEWMVSDPATRPARNAPVAEVRKVFCSARRHAALLSCAPNAVRCRVSRGTLVLNENG
jgi:hypothetical protein